MHVKALKSLSGELVKLEFLQEEPETQIIIKSTSGYFGQVDPKCWRLRTNHRLILEFCGTLV